MKKRAGDDIRDEEWRFVIAGIDVLVHRGKIKCRKEVDDYHINELNAIEYYNEEGDFLGEVELKVICQFLEIPDFFD